MTLHPDRSGDRARAPDDLVRAVESYERDLMAANFDALARAFWPDATRFGTDANQRGRAEIDAARRRSRLVLDRERTRSDLRLLSDDVAVSEVEFARSDGSGTGRQSQVWLRRGARWAIIHAHVSMSPRRSDAESGEQR